MRGSRLPLFSEEAYLRENPDVKRAIIIGQFKSGFDHFIRCGRFENRNGVEFDPLGQQYEDLHPPEALRLRVHGFSDLGTYLLVGQWIASDLERLLQAGSVSVPLNAKVLDFGCGPGRALCWFQPAHERWEFHGTDIDPEAIEWARKNLNDIAKFGCNEIWPPLDYPDGYFDFVYAISIFTHLPEDMQSAWLAELARVTRRGGYLALTTHGVDLLGPGFPIPSSGFCYKVGEITDGLPAFYQGAAHTHEYIKREWSRYFRVENIISRGLNDHQDVVVCTKMT